MKLARCYNVEDLRRAAQQRLPKGLFEFIDRATEDDVAMRRNREGFERLRLMPRALVDVSQRSTATRVFGREWSMPLAVSPAGPAGFFWHRGELALARAAASAGVPFTLSTYSTTPMEDIVASGAAVWLQLYLWNDRSISHGLVDKARALGVQALVVTVDTPVLGQREYLHRNGFLPPFKVSVRAGLDMLRHPRWLASVPVRYALSGQWPRVVNAPSPDPGQTAAQVDARASLSESAGWEDIARLRALWPHPLLIKGILRPEDAVRAMQIGCDGIIVSNHGGRNLDAAASPIDVLSRIVEAVGGKASVLMDSGVRRGSDIVRALALGATAVMAGRPMLYGVAAAGETGALHALELLRSELDRSMALLGCPSIAGIAPDLLASEAQ